jgi:DNA-binding transcriptional ArsR family regulator
MERPADAGLLAFCGSETRLLTFGVLAKTRRPLTGYRIAQLTGLPQTKVYKELRRAMLVGTVQRAADGFRLVDREIRDLLRQRFRLGGSAPPRKRVRPRDPERINLLYRRFERQPPPRWEGVGPVRSDLRRRRAKDELLVGRGMRPSVSHGT